MHTLLCRNIGPHAAALYICIPQCTTLGNNGIARTKVKKIEYRIMRSELGCRQGV